LTTDKTENGFASAKIGRQIHGSDLDDLGQFGRSYILLRVDLEAILDAGRRFSGLLRLFGQIHNISAKTPLPHLWSDFLLQMLQYFHLGQAFEGHWLPKVLVDRFHCD
jgi:hypothetical protein